MEEGGLTSLEHVLQGPGRWKSYGQPASQCNFKVSRTFAFIAARLSACPMPPQGTPNSEACLELMIYWERLHRYYQLEIRAGWNTPMMR